MLGFHLWQSVIVRIVQDAVETRRGIENDGGGVWVVAEKLLSFLKHVRVPVFGQGFDFGGFWAKTVVEDWGSVDRYKFVSIRSRVLVL